MWLNNVHYLSSGAQTVDIHSNANVRIYTDNEITGQVLRVINEAKSQLAIVSPYVDRVPHVEQAILRAKNNGARVVVFVRKDGSILGGSNSQDAIDWFKSNNVEVVGVPNLHAKYYMNDTEAVVTSMNLLKSSWSGSLELGFLVDGSAHLQLVEYLRNTLRVISNVPQPAFATPQKPSRAKPEPSRIDRSRPTKKMDSASTNNKGFFGSLLGAVKEILAMDAEYCIRCGEQLSEYDADVGNVLCRTDYKAWAKYKNPDYEENYCVTCGERRRTTYAKPQCESCFANGR